MRNGGRHRCQPPLRRVLDQPVFVSPTGSWDPPLNRSLHSSSGVASVSSIAPSSGALLPGPTGLFFLAGQPPCPFRLCRRSLLKPSCDRWSRGHRALRPGHFASAVVRSRFARPVRLAAFHSTSPELSTGPGILRPPDPHPSFRGPSWDDRSFRHPVRSEDRSIVRSEEDHLFRRLLPTSLSGDPSPVRSHPGEANVPANSTPAPSPAEIGCLMPLPVLPGPLRVRAVPAGAAAPDHLMKMTPNPIRAKPFRRHNGCG